MEAKTTFGGMIMEKLYQGLRIFLWCLIGVFIGSSLYQYIHYKAHPEIYQWQSAPWYTSIEVRGLFTVIAAAVVLGIMRLIKRRMR